MGSSTLGPEVEERFVNRVRSERKRHGWSQADLAEKMAARGLRAHPTTVAKIEAKKPADRRAVRLDEAAVLADIFGLTLDEMLELRRYAQTSALAEFAAAVSTSQGQVNEIASSLYDSAASLQVDNSDMARRTHDSSDADLTPDLIRSYEAYWPTWSAVSKLIEARDLLRESLAKTSMSETEVAELIDGDPNDPGDLRAFLQRFLPPDEFTQLS